MPIRCYHIKHRRDFSKELKKAKLVAEFAVASPKKKCSTKEVDIDLPSAIKDQLLRKYGRDNDIKTVRNANLIINTNPQKRKLKNGTIKWYRNIEYENGRVYIKPLKIYFRWNPGRAFDKIDQIEINNEKYMITVSFPDVPIRKDHANILGIDLNCGMGRSIVNAANLQTGELLNLGKKGPNIRYYYYKKRQEHNKKGKGHYIKGDKEKRIMKDLDHKISRKIVNYALKHKLKIVVEQLKNIRQSSQKGKKSRHVNRFVNSWSFYRLQSLIKYKAVELGIPFQKINPQYTSQECSYCTVIGDRKGDKFICNNKRCKVYMKERHADINAAFNIGKRSLVPGGVVKKDKEVLNISMKKSEKISLNLTLKEQDTLFENIAMFKHGSAQ